MSYPTPNAALASAMRTLCKNLNAASLEAAFTQCYRAQHRKRDSIALEPWETETIATDALLCGAARAGFPEYVVPYVQRHISAVL